ncbi:hypothetical protein [Collinsella stercoris]|uniref:Uncharacterized protein n=1 Tax=Collinsella stercoris DSM 13279 TaxID=445975 RepID=B6GDK9_9ACTN|nr:hypothetical protein [Collinsella stercoris]EEA89648.1 hypothetical protein COLSTE_02190 [Collinsella stercoris DSM 13279]UEA45175.1 hypothetical protein LK434_08585 [Collinsella stercoris DSM 13279]UWP12300.1 hypothetical protein NQ498_03445 [Collinsella stercoris]
MNCGDVVQIVATVVTAVIGFLTVGVALYVSWSAKWPDVMVYFEANKDDGITELVTKNFGIGVAYDVRIDGFNVGVIQKEYQDNVKQTFVQNGIPMLVPGAERRTIVFENDWAKDALRTTQMTVQVSFERRSLFRTRRKMSMSCILDYDSYAYAVYKHTVRKEMADSLKSIAESVQLKQ